MNKYLYFAAFALLAGIFVYLLYRRGLIVSKSIRAVLFLFQPGDGLDRATVDACTGWVRHAGRFRESGTYVFTLDMQLSAGTAEVVLLDNAKQPLLRLDRHTSKGEIALNGKGRYYLHWTFQSATGKCELRW